MSLQILQTHETERERERERRLTDRQKDSDVAREDGREEIRERKKAESGRERWNRVERWRLTTHTQTHKQRRRHRETHTDTQTDTQTGTEAMHFSRSPLMALAVTAIIDVLLFGPSMSLIFSVAC